MLLYAGFPCGSNTYFRMKLSEELTARGFVNQIAGESIEEIVDGPKRVVYHGIDPSADSAHAGNFVQWILLRHLANAGHKIIFLVGGGTGRIGDPKPDAERTLTETAVIDENVAKLKAQAEQLMGGEVEFVNNLDWLGSVGLIDFLRDIGKHFTINELIKKDAISRRMESEVGISYTEFAYPLLQAYDYLMLHRQYGCDLQTGGSDQWANIVAGVDLIRRVEGKIVYALTQALVVDKTTGKKFGKSEGNAVWLDPEKTSPYVFYQFWLNTSDENVIDFLKRFTFVPLSEITEIEQTFAVNPGARVAQKRLAHEVTMLVHGGEACALVEHASEALFGGVSFTDLTAEELSIVKENAPNFTIANKTTLIDALVAATLSSSKREARTFIEGGAVQVNGVKVEDVNRELSSEQDGADVLLRRGKKQYAIVSINE